MSANQEQNLKKEIKQLKPKNEELIKKQKKLAMKIFAVKIFLSSFFVSVLMSFFSQSVLEVSGLLVSLLILLIIIFIGIIFDIVGVAVTTCPEAPFHAMATKKNKYAKHALKMVKSAALVATISNDVVGDICGIISGAAAGNVVARLLEIWVGLNYTYLAMLLSGVVAAITVGGKSVGKIYAIENSKQITFQAAKVLYYLDMLRGNFFKKNKR